MTHFTKLFIVLVAMTSACITASAQPAAPPAARPTTDAAPAEAATSPADEAAAAVVETNPAVRAALEIPRTTPAEHFQAIVWLIDLDRPELAKPILDALTKLQMTDSQRADLVARFGSSDMLKLAQSKALAPAGTQFSRTCMDAAAAAANDPRRIATLVANLTDPSPEVRLIARNDLAATGQPGVVATLEAMAKQTDPARRVALASASRHMTPLVVGPLLAMLDTSDHALRDTVAELLRALSVRQAIPLLPQTAGSAEQILRQALHNYRRGMLPFAADENNQIEIWHWDDRAKKLSVSRYAADEARIIWMARLARDLARYFPENAGYARQAMVLELEAAALTGRAPFPEIAHQLELADVHLLNQTLAEALAAADAHAAIALINTLAARANGDILGSADSRPSPLASALRNTNRHVRFAALRAIMTLGPKSPYPGSSRVPEALAWFAAGTGERRAVVAMRTAVAATELAGLMPSERLQPTAAATGREAVDLALTMPDLEMIFVDVNINDPDIRQVVYELRINPTTAEIPIAILAPTSRLADAEQIASEHSRVIAVPRIHSPEVLNRVVTQLTTLSGRFATPANVRAAEAVEALTWLTRLAMGDRPFYKLRRSEPVVEAALYGAATAKPAITTLAQLSSPDAQRALVNFASQPTMPIALRTDAADAFRQNVVLHGVMLTSDEILTQYDRYNASERLDAETQQVLGTILDIIESRRNELPQSPAPSPRSPAIPSDAELPLPPQP
jgi:CheY-like chemotaxis protein